MFVNFYKVVVVCEFVLMWNILEVFGDVLISFCRILEGGIGFVVM